VGLEQKKNIIVDVLQGQGYSEIVVNLFRTLAEYGRLGLTLKVISSFEEIMRAYKGEVSVKITSAKVLLCTPFDSGFEGA
jgi:F-type H+-transporting ATPase subunit O